MNKVGIVLIIFTILLSACNSKDNNTVTMTVASEKRMAIGVAPMEVFLVKEGEEKDWSFFYSNIDNFNYEPGYEYILEVKKENIPTPTPADASAVKYNLVKEISKIKKDSENMLESVVTNPKYIWTAKVVDINNTDKCVDMGGATANVSINILKLEVTALNGVNLPFEEKETIYAELVADPKVSSEIGKEYVFKAQELHPAYTLGVCMLNTDVQDLTY